MAVTATYLSDLSRVRVSFTGMSSLADYATVERSIDGGLHWELVRGGSSVPVTAGAGHLDDYEFENGALNTYRVTAIDSQPQAWVGSGGPVTGVDGGSVSPGCNGSTLIGDLVLLYATVRFQGATVNQPAGWTTLLDMGNAKVFGRYATANGTVTQAVTFSGAGAGDDTTAQMTTFRNSDIAVAGTPATQSNASAQNIAWPGASPSVAGSFGVIAGWKQAGWSSAPVPSYALLGEAGQVSATTGNDSGHVWWVSQYRTTTEELPPGLWTVTGGSAQISKAGMFFLKPRGFTNQETTSITPVENRIVITNLGRPSLAIFPEIVSASNITRRSRAGIFDVQGRTLPVSVSDVQSSRQFTIELDLYAFENIADVDLKLASGAPLMLRMPPGDHYLPTCYVVVGDTRLRQDAKGSESMTIEVPLTEVAKPGDSVYGDTYVWADVVADYATWQDVLVDPQNTSWANLIDHVGDAEVIVP